MGNQKPRALDTGYTAEADLITEPAWNETLSEFDDANIYQTWAYGAVTSGERHNSHVVLRRDGEIVAMAQARIARLPVIPVGVAYVRWGPLWRRQGSEEGEVFRQAVRALRNEYVCRRGLALRLLPVLFQDSPAGLRTILSEEGFHSAASEANDRTILMDLRPPLEDLREGMKPHWKRELKVAGRNQLEIEAGTEDRLFGVFIEMYREMVSRKGFVEPNDIHQFRTLQKRLPVRQKMKILLCHSGGQVCAGVIASAIGNTAVYLFGATSNAGMKSRGSYALQWTLLGELKREGMATYDLNGINPEKNPGTYKFKAELAGTNGREVCFLGRFDAHGSPASAVFLQGGEGLRRGYRTLKERLRNARTAGLRPDPAR